MADTILHEMGHVIAGRLSGHRIYYLNFGSRELVSEFKWKGIRFRIRSLPFGGNVFGILKSPAVRRLKESVFTLGGPLANALAVVVAAKLLWLDDRLSSGLFYNFAPVKMFLISNAVSLPYSLYPHRFKSDRGMQANDGLLLWQIWRRKVANQEASSLLYLTLFEAEECRRERKFADALNLIEKGLSQFPENQTLVVAKAAILGSEGNWVEARNACYPILAQAAKQPALLTLLQNNIAYLSAHSGRLDWLPEADDFSKRALENKPSYPYYKGTRGAVLIELGRYEEAVPLLEDALLHHSDKSAKALNACSLGVASIRGGNIAESAAYFAIARKLDPFCPLLDREKKESATAAAPK